MNTKPRNFSSQLFKEAFLRDYGADAWADVASYLDAQYDLAADSYDSALARFGDSTKARSVMLDVLAAGVLMPVEGGAWAHRHIGRMFPWAGPTESPEREA